MGSCASKPLPSGEQPPKSSEQPLQQTREKPKPEKAAELQPTVENSRQPAVPASRRLEKETALMESQVAWYRDERDENLFEPHMTDPPEFLTPDQVLEKTRVRLSRVENCDDEEVQAKVRLDGNFMAHDWLEISKEVLQDAYEAKLEKYYSEHLHTDPEIRLIVAGSGYFEVRDANDKWIRLRVTKGTLINLPGGMYHRLTLDSNHYIKMLRLFSEIPAWEALNRPEGDTHPVREEHLSALPTDAPVDEA